VNRLKKIAVFEGQMVITTVPSEISTILGSCVSVCLWDRETKQAGMNHFLLPGEKDNPIGNLNQGFAATSRLINSMLNRNSRIENLQAKVFGGCNSLFQKSTLSVGAVNLAAAKFVLSQKGIPITSSNTGGIHGRRIVFNTHTGMVQVKFLKQIADNTNEEINKGFGM
jgi:chemotaxis protein CheD